MTHRIRALFRSQGLGLLALFLALGTGTAYAAAARNSVTSASIKDGQVRTADVARNAVTGTRIATGAVGSQQVRDGSILGDDVADGGLSGPDFAGDSIGTLQVAGLSGYDFSLDSITGDSIDESTLATVPRALQAGAGRNSPGTGGCDPGSGTFVPCAATTAELATEGRVLIIGSAQGSTEAGGYAMGGSCRLTIDGVAQPNSTAQFLDFKDGTNDVYDTVPLAMVTAVLPAGSHSVGVECNQSSLLIVDRARVLTVALSSR